MTGYRKTKRAFERQHINQNLGHEAHDDSRTLEQKASDLAIMTIRRKINDLLTVKDSFDFIAALDATVDKWSVFNNKKYHTIVILTEAIDKIKPEYPMSVYRLQKAKDAATLAGWTVRGGGWGGQYEVEWIG